MRGAQHGAQPYTDEDKVFIRQNYAKLGPTETAAKLKRTAASVRAQARKLGVSEARTGRPVKNPTHRVSKVAAPAPAPELAPAPVSESLRRLAKFDPMLKRVVAERESGGAPGCFINLWEASFR